MKKKFFAVLVASIIPALLLPTVCLADETADRAISEWTTCLQVYDRLYEYAGETATALKGYCETPDWETLMKVRLMMAESLAFLDAQEAPTYDFTDDEIIDSSIDLLTMCAEMDNCAEELDAERNVESGMQMLLYTPTLLCEEESTAAYADIAASKEQVVDLLCKYTALTSRYLLSSYQWDDAVWNSWKEAAPYLFRCAEEIEVLTDDELETYASGVLTEIEQMLPEREEDETAVLNAFLLDTKDGLTDNMSRTETVLQGEVPAIMPLPDWNVFYEDEGTNDELRVLYYRKDESGNQVRMSAEDTGTPELCLMTMNGVSEDEYMEYLQKAKTQGMTVAEMDSGEEGVTQYYVTNPETGAYLVIDHRDETARIWILDQNMLLLPM